MRFTFKSLTLIAACVAALTACGGGGTSSDSQAVQSKHLVRSDKEASAADYANLVQELYISYYGRPADPAGLAYWEGVLAAKNAPTTLQGLNSAYSTNAAVNAIVNGFGNSAESLALYGTGTPTQFVTAIYNNALGRTPDPGGLDYWVGLIADNKVSQAQAAMAIIEGAAIEPTTSSDEQLVSNRLTAAIYFTAQVSSQSASSAYSGGAANATVRTMLDSVTATTTAATYQASVNTTITALVADANNNMVPIIVDDGPAALAIGPDATTAINEPFVTVTICAPANPTLCQTIDHVLVDTGSEGLRIISSVLTSQMYAALSLQTSTSGSTMNECTEFADGYTWGPIRTVNLQVGGESVNNLLMQVIGDPSFPTAPSACTANASGPSENTVQSFGSNGVIGVGLFQQDCGAYCATDNSQGYDYYLCSGSSCTPTAASLAQQVPNPVSQLAYDNNGVIISLPAIPGGVAATASGTITFGVGTRGNNSVGSATVFPMDDIGNFTTLYNGVALNESFIDSGSNGLYFPNSDYPPIGVNPSPPTGDGFYGPASLLSQSATMESLPNGVLQASEPISFTIGNVDAVTYNNGNFAVYLPLGAPNPGTAFDWGLPFFFGRNVYVVTENQKVNGQTGPFNAF